MDHETLLGRLRETLATAKEVSEIPGEDPDSGAVLIAGAGAERVIGALAKLKGQLPKLARTIRGENPTVPARDLPVAVIEMRETGTQGHEIRRTPSHRPWGLEDIAVDLLSCTEIETGGGGEFRLHMLAPAWLGIGVASGGIEDAQATAGVVAVLTATSASRMGLAAVAAAMAGSLGRMATAASECMRRILMASAEEVDSALDLSMGMLSLIGDREESSMRSLLELPWGERHKELIDGYARALSMLAEQAMRRLLDFHASAAGRAFDARKLTQPEGIDPELLSARPIRLQDINSFDPEMDTWKHVAMELADGLLGVDEIRRRLLLDFPGLGIRAVCSLFGEFAAAGKIQLLSERELD